MKKRKTTRREKTRTNGKKRKTKRNGREEQDKKRNCRRWQKAKVRVGRRRMAPNRKHPTLGTQHWAPNTGQHPTTVFGGYPTPSHCFPWMEQK